MLSARSFFKGTRTLTGTFTPFRCPIKCRTNGGIYVKTSDQCNAAHRCAARIANNLHDRNTDEAVKAKIPQKPDDNDNTVVNPDTLIVAISSDSSLRINLEQNLGTVEDPTKTIERLTEVFRLRKNNYIAASMDESSIPKTVFIKAPHGIDYGSVAKVVDAVKASGANPISLQIDDLD